MKRIFLSLAMLASLTTTFAQTKVYTLQDWKIKDYDPAKELCLNVRVYKLDFNHPLPLWQADRQKEHSLSLPYSIPPISQKACRQDSPLMLRHLIIMT